MNVTFGVFMLILLCSGISYAQSAGETLNFKTVVQLAYQHHPDMLNARASLKLAQGDFINARSFSNPEIELGLGDESSFELRQPFSPLGVGFLKSKIAKNEVKIQEQYLKSSWGSVYTKVWQIYSDVLISQNQLELAEQNLESMRHFFGEVQIRYQSGRALKNEVQRAKIELLKTESEFLQVQGKLREAKARVNLAIGRSIDVDFKTEEQLNEYELDLEIEQIKAKALANRPDIKIAGLRVDSARNNLAKEQLSRLPSFFLGLQKTNKESDKDYTVLLGFSIPIWNLNQGEVKKANAQKELQEANQSITVNEALLDVHTAFWDVELKKQQLDLFKASVEEAHELLRLAHTRYGEGKIDFLNYLDQVSAVIEAKTSYYQALLNYSQSISHLEVSMNQSLRGEEGFHEKP